MPRAATIDRQPLVMMEGPRYGAYGLRVTGLPQAEELLPIAPLDWIDWRINRVIGHGVATGEIGGDHASVAAGASGALMVDRAEATATLTSPRAPTDSEFVHPYLGAVAAIVSRWRGLPSFHAGGFFLDGRVWGVLGAPGQGKTTLLAYLATRGIGVASDDLLVIAADAMALSGPRCLDLREDVAAAFGLGVSIGVVGARERWRLNLGAVPSSGPLMGWLLLSWGDSVSVRELAPSSRVRNLLAYQTIVPGPPNPLDVLDLAKAPMFEITRPADLSACDAVAERVLSVCAGAATPYAVG